MTYYYKASLFFLRVSLGWMFFYAGFSKLINPNWSSVGYIGSAKTFPELYAWFAQSSVLPVVNMLNEWGLTLIGISLILGIFVRVSSLFGILMMALYYFPILDFPLVKTTSYIVDDHIIIIGIFLVFIAQRVGRVWGLDGWCAGLPICKRFPRIRSLIG